MRIWTSFVEFWMPREPVEDRARRLLRDVEHRLLEAQILATRHQGVVDGLHAQRDLLLSASEGVDSSDIPGHNGGIIPGDQ